MGGGQGPRRVRRARPLQRPGPLRLKSDPTCRWHFTSSELFQGPIRRRWHVPSEPPVISKLTSRLIDDAHQTGRRSEGSQIARAAGLPRGPNLSAVGAAERLSFQVNYPHVRAGRAAEQRKRGCKTEMITPTSPAARGKRDFSDSIFLLLLLWRSFHARSSATSYSYASFCFRRCERERNGRGE